MSSAGPVFQASVAVVGTGVVGLELAQALHRLGVRVRLFGRGSRIGPLTHPALQVLTREVFASELPLSLGVRDLQTRREGDAVVLHTALADGKVQEERFDFLLAATGRRPNVAPPGPRTHDAAARPARRAGVRPPHRTGRRQRRVHGGAMRQTTVRCCTRRPTKGASPATTPAAGPRCACGRAEHRWPWSSANRRWRWWAPRMPNWWLRVPLSKSGEVSFADQGRSRVMGRNHGALQVYAQRDSGRLLGAEMLGPRRRAPGPPSGMVGSAGRHGPADAGQPVLPPGGGRRSENRTAPCAACLAAARHPPPEHCLVCNA